MYCTMTDRCAVTLDRNEWNALLTTLNAINDLDCDDETTETIAALQNKIQRQV